MTRTERAMTEDRVGLLELAGQRGNICPLDEPSGLAGLPDCLAPRGIASPASAIFTERGGALALAEISKAKPKLKSRVAPEVQAVVVALALAFEQPARGQARLADERRRRGIKVSPFGARTIRLRHDLAAMKHRLQALEAKLAREGGGLSG